MPCCLRNHILRNEQGMFHYNANVNLWKMMIAWHQVSYKMTFHHVFISLFTLSLHFVPSLQFVPSLHFIPVCSLHFVLTDILIYFYLFVASSHFEHPIDIFSCLVMSSCMPQEHTTKIKCHLTTWLSILPELGLKLLNCFPVNKFCFLVCMD